jgi:glycerol-3-phosphate acyltransferase PlsY
MIVLALLLSYFIGAVPFGFLIGKLRGVDVRAVGSGNIGATNVWRTLGPAAGTLAFALDVGKGVAGPLLGGVLLGPHDAPGIALCGIAALLGHVFSVFLKFRGGKGIATGLGVMLGLAPVAAVACFALWGVILLVSRIISVASIAACLALPVAARLTHAPPAYQAVIGLMALIALLKHIPNMKRLRVGAEPKIGRRSTLTEASGQETAVGR